MTSPASDRELAREFYGSRHAHEDLEFALSVESTGSIFNSRKQQWEYWVVDRNGFKYLTACLTAIAVLYSDERTYALWVRQSQRNANYIIGSFQFALGAAADTLLNQLKNGRSNLPVPLSIAMTYQPGTPYWVGSGSGTPGPVTGAFAHTSDGTRA